MIRTKLAGKFETIHNIQCQLFPILIVIESGSSFYRSVSQFTIAVGLELFFHTAN